MTQTEYLPIPPEIKTGDTLSVYFSAFLPGVQDIKGWRRPDLRIWRHGETLLACYEMRIFEVKRTSEVVFEGNDPIEFWSALKYDSRKGTNDLEGEILRAYLAEPVPPDAVEAYNRARTRWAAGLSIEDADYLLTLRWGHSIEHQGIAPGIEQVAVDEKPPSTRIAQSKGA